MSKRILSLALALVMVILAVPVMAFSALADGETLPEKNPTVNFRTGATYDEATLTTAHGEILQTKTWAELLADPSLLNPKVEEEAPIAWAWWDATAQKYITLADFFRGAAELPDAEVMDVYPIMPTTSYLDGLPIISATDDDENAETPAKLALEMYRSGWTFTTPYKPNMLLMTIEQGTKANRGWYRGYLQAWAGDRAPLYGAVLQNGDILLGHNTAGYKEYATGLTWQVPVSGKYYVTLPKADNVQILVIVNGICVLGAEDQIGQANPALNGVKDAETGIAPEDADWFTFGLATDEGYDALTDKVVKVSAKAGEKIDIIVKRNYPEDAVPPRDVPARDDQWLKGWAPTIALEKAYTVNLMQGPATSNGMNNAGTCVGTIPMDYLSAYADYALDGTNFGYAEGELLDWSAWSTERGCFILLSDCISGKEALPATNFYPMLKDTTTVPYYTNRIEGENQLIWEAAEDAAEGKLLGYTGGWSYGSYIGNDYKTFTNIHKPNPTAYPKTWLLVREDARYQAAGAVYNGLSGGFWSNAKDAAGSLRYQAPKNGTILVKIPHAYAAGTYAVIAKNGTVAWPAAAAGKPAAAPTAQEVADTWYAVPVDTTKVVDRTVRYADENCVSFELNVAAGDYVEILYMHYVPEAKNGKNEWWYPGVEYTALYEAPTGVAAVPSIGDTLAVDFEAMLPDGCDFEGGVLVNGEVADSISFAPYDADEEFTVQPFYVLDESTKIYGEEKTYTFNSLMALYEGTPYAKLAKAALNYTAAFEALFGEGDIPTVPSFTGTYNSTMGAVDYTGEGEVIISAASLIVNEKIGIKLVVRELPEGAKLQIASDKAFTTILNADADTMTATSDNTGHKYIMDGISIANFDTMYYFRVVDADGAVISDTVQYSVSTYCARMANSTNLKLSSLVHAMMGLYEAGTAN